MMYFFQWILLLNLLAFYGVKSDGDGNQNAGSLDGLDDLEIAIKLAEEKASIVSSLLKTSAERAAANAPIIVNRDSELYKNYQQQRLPRR